MSLEIIDGKLFKVIQAGKATIKTELSSKYYNLDGSRKSVTTEDSETLKLLKAIAKKVGA